MSTAQAIKGQVRTSQDSPPEWIRWVIAVTVSVAALLEVLDTSIVNVALTQIQGNLGATLSEAGWVITGYAVANAIVIPLSAFLGDYFGKKAYFISALVGFTLASLICGLAPNLPALIAARIAQGLFGGGLLAKAQAILFETFPPEEQGAAQGLFGLCIMVGPVLGPTLGGFLTDTFNWRMIFFINIPVGILAVILALAFLPASAKKSVSIDWWGIFLLIVTIGSLQTVLEDGQRDDWFSSSNIVRLSIAALIGGILFVCRELSVPQPAVDLRVLRFKSLAAGSAFSLVLGMGLYGMTFAVPIFAQTIMHYTAMQTGMLMVPGALATTVMMPVFARLAGKIDARLMIAGGAILSIIACLQFANMNVNSNTDSMFWPLIIRGLASIFMFMPLSTATLGCLPKQYIQAGAGFFSLTRQLGGSIGIAALTTILDQRTSFHRAILVEHINPYNPAFHNTLQHLSPALMSLGSPNHASYLKAMGAIEGMVNTQATVMSFADSFYIVSLMFAIALPLLIFLGSGKRSAAPADAH